MSKRLPTELRALIAETMCSLDRDEFGRAVLASGLMSHMVPVVPEDYDDVRSMLAACEAAGFLEIK